MEIRDLPAANALLNTISAAFLITGYVMIKRRKIDLHRAAMVSAFVTSIVFLLSYLTYHYYHGSTRFQGDPTVRTIYLTILLTHTILAAAVPFLSVFTLYRATKKRWESHKRLARWTLPIWLYVSITGVVVYWMLYQL